MIPLDFRKLISEVIISDDASHDHRVSTQILREIRRVPRPGGQLLLSVPNFAHW